MGERGPVPTSTQQKIAQGNPGHVAGLKQNFTQEPQPTRRIPSCPRFLTPAARKEWRRVAPELDAEDLLTGCDRAVLAAYCQTWARWQQAEEIIDKEGLTTTGPTGWVQPSPEVGISIKMLAAMKGFATQLGLSPSARSRIQIERPKERAADPVERRLAIAPPRKTA